MANELKEGTVNIIFENVLPIMVKFIIAIGIVICFLSVLIAIYTYIKRKRDTKTILKKYGAIFLGGVTISMCGVLVNFIANFNIGVSSYKKEMAFYLFIYLFVYSLYMKVSK